VAVDPYIIGIDTGGTFTDVTLINTEACANSSNRASTSA
jgi:N-methylhydantoinase A/oxoprolinase/acetone carboxylase beta subunit